MKRVGIFAGVRSGVDRARIERNEQWREGINLMPPLHFPKSWEVRIIPPFSGAFARFLVTYKAAEVSVYADFLDALGCVGEPYWEIYPGPSGDTDRYLLDESNAMLAGIAKSLVKQNRQQVHAILENEHD